MLQVQRNFVAGLLGDPGQFRAWPCKVDAAPVGAETACASGRDSVPRLRRIQTLGHSILRLDELRAQGESERGAGCGLGSIADCAPPSVEREVFRPLLEGDTIAAVITCPKEVIPRERGGLPALSLSPAARRYVDLAKRLRRLATPKLAPAIAAVRRPTMLVVTQVRQALQQTVAIGACSPYFSAASAMRPVQACLMLRV
jgi:hypothetical protein